MTKEEYINKLNELNLDKSKYCIIAGGVLLFHGLKDTTNDIDIRVLPHYFEELKTKFNFKKSDKYTYLWELSNNIELAVLDYDVNDIDIIDGDIVEISIDEYPFGICLEIENKSENKDPFDVVKNWVSKLDLNINDAYRLSWDDKYSELCEEQGVEKFNEVTFDKPMPSLKNN